MRISLFYLFCIGDTEEEEEQEADADEYDTAADESASKSQLDVSADDAEPDVQAKSPTAESVETPAPKIASPVQQVIDKELMCYVSLDTKSVNIFPIHPSS